MMVMPSCCSVVSSFGAALLLGIVPLFNEMGVAAFVLKYRIPNEATMPDKEIGPLQDAQQAIKVVRERAKEWNVDPNRIGIMGFSAGGHLAAMMLATNWPQFDQRVTKDTIKGVFAISGLYNLLPVQLCYVNDTLKMAKEAAIMEVA